MKQILLNFLVYINNFIKINPHDWALIKSMIKINDGEFKNKLDQYKYISNKEASLKTKYRKECEIYIKNIDERLEKQEYLLSNNFELFIILIKYKKFQDLE